MTHNQTKISISRGGLEAVENLLLAAKLSGIGITIEPDSLGWKVGYILPSGGGELAAAYDLETAVRAAERPFNELADWLRGRLEEFHEQKGREQAETGDGAEAEHELTVADVTAAAGVTAVADVSAADDVTALNEADAEDEAAVPDEAAEDDDAKADDGPGEDKDS